MTQRITRQDWERVAAGFRSLGYLRHNQRRQEHLAALGLDLVDKTVLELGAGVGDHTTFFLDRGCTVTAVEPRLECCQFLLESYKNAHYTAPVKLKLLNIDVESLPAHVTERFDIVYCYGLLYHVADPARVITLMAERCAGVGLIASPAPIVTAVSSSRTPAHVEFPDDWTGPPPADRMTRAVFVAARHPLGLSTLLDHLPDRQPKP